MSFIINPFQFAGASETNNPNKNVRKNSGANAWDAGYESTETIPSATAGYTKVTAKLTDHAGGTANYLMHGLSRASDSAAVGFTGIRYCAYLRFNSGSHSFWGYESGSSVFSSVSIADDDTMEVHRSASGVITYKKNGVTQHTSAISDTSELKIDGSPFGLDDRGLNVILERGNGEFNPNFQNLTKCAQYA